MNLKRVRTIYEGQGSEGPVVYWMSRDQRAQDNWALTFAQELAKKNQTALGVIFCLAPAFPGATHRAYDFMLQGLREVESELAARDIPFFLLIGEPGEKIPEFIRRYDVGTMVADFDPLRIKRQWQNDVVKKIEIPFYEVDAHNIVPCRIASQKQEYGAYTLRPKIHRLLPEFLDEFVPLHRQRTMWAGNVDDIAWNRIDLAWDRSVKPVEWLKPGSRIGHRILRDFITNKLERYAMDRNDPTIDGQSNLSPYFHFGQISPQRAAMEVLRSRASLGAKEVFLEELIIRRELSDNFCLYNSAYDRFDGIPQWAQRTLSEHRKDRRMPTYTHEELEHAATDDPLWNAAQREMVSRGKMHGFMRMYWGKKILEWSPTPQDALTWAMELNDRYELDGRDPNGYTGIGWCIGGVHDRAWKSRPIFGKIRYMSYNGCKKKFDIEAYIQRYGNTII